MLQITLQVPSTAEPMFITTAQLLEGRIILVMIPRKCELALPLLLVNTLCSFLRAKMAVISYKIHIS